MSGTLNIKMKSNKFTIPIWEVDVLLLVGGEELDILKIVKKHKVSKKTLYEIEKDKITKKTHGACWFDEGQILGIVWFPTNNPKKLTLTHEVRHLIDYMFMWIGALEEMEATAYTTEWLEDHIMNTLKKI